MLLLKKNSRYAHLLIDMTYRELLHAGVSQTGSYLSEILDNTRSACCVICAFKMLGL